VRISDLRPEEVRAYFESRGIKFHGPSVKQSTRCPFHQDKNPSLSVDLGKAVWRCWSGCGEGGLLAFEKKFAGHGETQRALKAIFESVGQSYEPGVGPEEEPERIYTYTDEHNRILFQKLRFAGVTEDGHKRFLIRKEAPNGGWIHTSQDVRKVLYNLAGVITANVVAICEGEHDADEFNRANLSIFDPGGFSRFEATTNFDGGSNWNSKYSHYMIGKDVFLFPHFDPTGMKHALMVAASVQPFANTVRVVELPFTREHEDLADFLQSHPPADLLREMQKAVIYQPVKSPLLVPASEFLSRQDEEIEWILTGLIQRGANGFIVASPKVGKSYLSNDLAIALALGREWMGFSVPRRTKVAYISREDTPALTKWRMRKLLATWGATEHDIDAWLHVNSRDQSPQFKLDNPEQFNEMLVALKQFGPEIVFLDVLNIMHTSEENDNTQMRKVLDKADELGKELSCSISVLHHFNKETKARLTERIRGASSMSGWVEWVIGLHKDKEEDDEDTLRWAEFDLKASSPPNHLYFHIQGYDGYDNPVKRASDPRDIHRMAIDRAEAPEKRGRRRRVEADGVSVP
jgi:hypothetical protein